MFSKGKQMDDQTLPTLNVRIRELNENPKSLLDLVPTASGLSAWLGTKVHIVGWGTALRLDFNGAHAMREAARVWERVAAKANCRYAEPAYRSGSTSSSVEGESDLGALTEHESNFTWPLALGSFGFSDSTTGYLVVPQTTIACRNGRCWVVTAAINEEAADPKTALDVTHEKLTPPAGLWTEPGKMTQNKWKETVRRLTLMLQSGAASKVVLTRDIVVSASTPIDERFLAGELQKRYGSTWVYAVEGLIGATPEMLASLQDGHFLSRVLAGTSAPGEGEKLLASIKNRTEHHLAVESVSRALGPLSESMTVPTEPELLDLPNVTHLATEVKAVIPDGNVLDIVDALHPTAAVCGTPTRLAFDILEDIEGTQRGRYSGPVGWIDGQGDGEFGIALRCGQLSNDRMQIRVFAGGGIMPDSVPDLELAETRAKMRPVLEALSIED